MAYEKTDAEARRLAEQRRSDLAEINERELERAREAGRREALAEQERREAHEQFASINASIRTLSTVQAELKGEVHEIKIELARRDAVNEALVKTNAEVGAKKLTRIQTRLMVSGGVITFLSFLLAVAVAIGHA